MEINLISFTLKDKVYTYSNFLTSLKYTTFYGVYELWSMTTENYVHRGVKELKNSLEGSIDGTGKSILCGSFRSTVGPQGNVYFLMRHENFDDAVDFRTQWLSNKGM